jgi:hypothetical protein
MHFVNKACAVAYRNPLRFSNGIPAARPYFLPTAVKSRQKGPLSGQLTDPILRIPCYQTGAELNRRMWASSTSSLAAVT